MSMLTEEEYDKIIEIAEGNAKAMGAEAVDLYIQCALTAAYTSGLSIEDFEKRFHRISNLWWKLVPGPEATGELRETRSKPRR